MLPREEAGGHGTHVAGTLVGAESGEVAGDGVADGMAFQGKIAVFDFGDSDNSNALTTPDEVNELSLLAVSCGGSAAPGWGIQTYLAVEGDIHIS